MNKVLYLLAVAITVLVAHPGGLDSKGCHKSSLSNKNHCHNKESSESGYSRDLYKHWIDTDKDGQDARQEILIRDSKVSVILNDKGSVIAGKWLCPYTGESFIDPKDLDIDHFIPLKEVHESGGDLWTPEKRKQYANDLSKNRRTLVAVKASANRSKGAKDISFWLPKKDTCEYIKHWIYLKSYWELSMDSLEKNTIKRLQSKCP